MKYTILFLILFPFCSFAQQECVKVDTVYVTAKMKQLSNRDIRFGIKQTTEEILSEKYCLTDIGTPVAVEVSYIGMPTQSFRIGGIGSESQTTEVAVKLHFKDKEFEGTGSSSTDVRTIMIELKDGKVPFSKMTISNALKMAIQDAVSKM
jgi:hypothetical protein